MKTYLVIWHNSEGENPLLVKDRLMSIGFRPVAGYHDYEYDHRRSVTIPEILDFSIRVHETLRGSGVLYKLETIDGEE